MTNNQDKSQSNDSNKSSQKKEGKIKGWNTGLSIVDKALRVIDDIGKIKKN